MTDNITWGDPIEVNGKRPAWLRDDEQTIRWLKPDGAKPREGGPCEAGEHNWGRYVHHPDKPTDTSHIRLPADHFAYKAIAAGFEPWGGGDAAPEDWDGGETLCRDGGTFSGPVSWWTHDLNKPATSSDIIGYRRKRVTAQPAFDPAPHLATYDPATHVAVPLMTEAEARDFWLYKDATASTWLLHAKKLGIIRPDPTPLDRFKAAHPDWALRDREDLIADVIAWREGT